MNRMVNIGSDNGVVLNRHKAISRTSADLLSIRLLETSFNAIQLKM